MRRILKRLKPIKDDQSSRTNERLRYKVTHLFRSALRFVWQRQPKREEVLSRVIQKRMAIGLIVPLTLTIKRPVDRLRNTLIASLSPRFQPMPNERRLANAAIRDNLD